MNFGLRLDEILKTYKQMVIEDEYNIKNTYTESDAKQDLTSLIKELVAEAKPGTWVDPEDTDDLEWLGYVNGVNDFEQNLLKALEEVNR